MRAAWPTQHRLPQSDEALLRLCRLCCPVRMHCQGMTVDEATRFFREHCHYEEKPARSEAMRWFHDELLAHGAPAPALLRPFVLGERR